ncbi:MAG TPA: efflux RND transporter permease subunit [Chitinispirillaceae bacterium]|nr:efflux RND transporter permease subunit [Chitinispirillaceae bacterium]
MNIAGISIRRPLLMIMCILAVSMFGVVGFLRLPIDKMPDMELPYITVQAIYPGAGPDQIELNVVKPIEEQVSTIGGLKHVTSYCMESAAFLVLEFNAEIDADLVSIEVKDKIDQILYSLPDELEKPIISKFNPNDQPIVTLSVTAPVSPDKLRNYVDNQIKDHFSQINGVAKVAVVGGREREIVINLNPEKMSAHNLTIFQVATLIKAQNKTIPGGFVTGKRKEYSVKVSGEYTSLDQIRELQIPVFKQYGAEVQNYTVRLKDIATVEDAYKDVREFARFQGKESVQISITKNSDGNVVGIADMILKKVKEITPLLPSGYSIDVIENSSTFIKNTVDDTYSNIISGIVLTALILLLFLFDWRVTIIAAVTMPISLIMAIVGMSWAGFTLNTITLMALTISVGVLVTNSILVIENIVRHCNNGQDVRKASEEGTNEIFMAVLASTLTNLAVFIPIATTTGAIGSVFKSLGLTIVFATVASIFLSFTLTPLMASRMLKPRKADQLEKKIRNPLDWFLSWLDRLYENSLDKVLSSKIGQFAVVLSVIIVFWTTMQFLAPKLGSEFQPNMDEGVVAISIELPSGTPIDITQKHVLAVEDMMKNLPDLVSISSSIGGSGTKTGVQYGEVRLQFTPETEREESVFDKINTIRPMLSDIPDAIISVTSAGGFGGGGAEQDMVIEVKGIEMNKLIDLSNQVINIVSQTPGMTDISSSWKGDKPEICIIPDRERLEHYGLSPNLAQSTTIQMLGGLVRYNITGDDEAIYRENGEDFPIRIQLDKRSRNTVRDVQTMEILTPKGPVPLEAIADVKYTGGISSITRKDKQRMIQITANKTSGNIGKKTEAIKKQFSALKLESGYSINFAGMQDMQDDSFKQLGTAAFLAIALTFMLLVALLESLSMAFVIMLTIPLGLIGVIWFLFLSNGAISMISLMSIVMLIGIVVNNAILLIDYAQTLRLTKGLSAKEAMTKAGGTKLKAIIMSNIAIIISMIPMALGLGSGGSFRAPFAITAIGGVIVSTLFTFYLIPILYIWTAPSLKKLKDEYQSEHAV